MHIYDKLKQYIKENSQLVKNEQFDKLFQGLEKYWSIEIFQPGNQLMYLLTEAGYDVLENVEHIYSNMYYKNENIITFTVPSHIRTIKHKAFYKCKNLEKLIIDIPITEISYQMCSCCNNLTEITIPDTVEHINSEAFYRCTNLSNFVLPSSITKIDEGAFGETTFTSISYNGMMKQFRATKLHLRKLWRADSKINTISCIDGDIVLK